MSYVADVVQNLETKLAELEAEIARIRAEGETEIEQARARLETRLEPKVRDRDVMARMLASAKGIDVGALTARPESVTSDSVTATPIERIRHADAVKSSSPEYAKFRRQIGIPHAGGKGYTIRSLEQQLRAEKHVFSRQYMADVLIEKVQRANQHTSVRIWELTGYQLPWERIQGATADFWADRDRAKKRGK